jgi:hypothetical protein
MNLSKNSSDPNYLPRKISNINFYDNRQKPNFLLATKFIADFHVLGLFMAKKQDLSQKKIPSVTRRCRCRCR